MNWSIVRISVIFISFQHKNLLRFEAAFGSLLAASFLL